MTPNSFSDISSMLFNIEVLKKSLTQFGKIPGIIFDFGFESTAPMNSAISETEERDRFDYFFENIAGIDLNHQWISFDTYRPSNYLYFEEKFKSRYHGCGFIFNDVSGVLDTEVLELLKSKRFLEPFYYIYTCTHIPSKDKVLNHMNFLIEGDILNQTVDHFQNGFKKLKELGIEKKILLDPGFGFSKSFSQNWDMINRFDQLVLNLKNLGIDCPWLIGISKKSFLRSAILDSTDPFKYAEILHAKIIKDLTEKKMGHLIFRAHDPFLVESAYARF